MFRQRHWQYFSIFENWWILKIFSSGPPYININRPQCIAVRLKSKMALPLITTQFNACLAPVRVIIPWNATVVAVSDHSLIYGCRKIAFSRNPSKLVESRCLKSYKSSAFKADVNECLFMSDWATNNPNASWNQFNNVFNYVVDVHAPIKTRRVRRTYAPWLIKNIKTEMNYRQWRI